VTPNGTLLQPQLKGFILIPQLFWVAYLLMANLARNDILDLSISERIQLVEDIWDSIAEVPESLSLTDEQKTELDRRLDGYHQDPTKGSPWEDVLTRIRKGA